MEITEKITIDMLTTDSVSILKQTFINYDGKLQQVGDNVRNAYMNSISGRAELATVLDEPYLSSVMSVWGETPTVEEPVTETEVKNNGIYK